MTVINVSCLLKLEEKLAELGLNTMELVEDLKLRLFEFIEGNPQDPRI